MTLSRNTNFEKGFKCLEIPISETFKWSNMKFHISVEEDLMNVIKLILERAEQGPCKIE